MHKDITPQEVEGLIQSKEDFLLVDVRTPKEHQELGYITGAKLLPLQDIPVSFKELPRDKKLIFICQKGFRSQKACEFLAAQGFGSLYNMLGGMSDWSGSHLTKNEEIKK